MAPCETLSRTTFVPCPGRHELGYLAYGDDAANVLCHVVWTRATAQLTIFRNSPSLLTAAPRASGVPLRARSLGDSSARREHPGTLPPSPAGGGLTLAACNLSARSTLARPSHPPPATTRRPHAPHPRPPHHLRLPL